MATKPATLPRAWATLANYDTGPFIGSAMKSDPGAGIAASGHRPGAAFPTPAEYENYQQYHITNWIDTWLALGSSAGAADAHIVETASTGRTSLVGLTLNDAVDETVLSVTGVNALAPTVNATCTTGAVVYQSNIGASSGTGFSAPVGVGAGTGFSSSLTGSVGGFGVDVSCDAATTGIGIRSSHAGSDYAAEFISTGSAAALRVNSTGGSLTSASISGGTTRALQATGSGAGLGADITSGSTAGTNALLATINNNTGKSVVAALPGTATSAARGFYCNTNGSAAIAAEFSASGSGASGNYALSLSGDPTTPFRGILFMTPQNADPSGGGVSGAVAMSTAKGLTLGNFSDGTWRSVWHSVNGYACAFASLYGYGAVGLTIPNAVFTSVAVVATANSGDEIKAAGATILLRLSFSMKSNSAAESFMSIRVEDTTAGGVIVWQRAGIGNADTAGYAIPANTATFFWMPAPTIEFTVVVPATGTRTYTVKMAAPTVVPFRIRDLTVAFVGTVA